MIFETTGVKKSLFMNWKLCPQTTQVPWLCWPLLSLLASVHSPAFLAAPSTLLRGNYLSLTLGFNCLHSVDIIPLSQYLSWVEHRFRHNHMTHQDTERVHKPRATQVWLEEPYGLLSLFSSCWLVPRTKQCSMLFFNSQSLISSLANYRIISARQKGPHLF